MRNSLITLAMFAVPDPWTWHEKVAWGANLILVIVGICGVVAAVYTLRVIQKQAGHMERQTGILEKSVAAAETSANAAAAQIEMMKSKERAQFRVEFNALYLKPDYEYVKYGGYQVSFSVIMDGTTRAYILSETIVASILSGEKREYRLNMGLPRNFTPEMGSFSGITYLQTNRFPRAIETDEGKMRRVFESELFVAVEGSIYYRDLFRGHWLLKFHRTWKYNSFLTGDKNAVGGIWEWSGENGANDHKQVEQPAQPNLDTTYLPPV